MTRRMLGGGLVGVATGLAAVAGGCAGGTPSTQPSSPADRQAAILRDPMGYQPALGHNGTPGSVFNNDDRGTLRHDVNDLLDP